RLRARRRAARAVPLDRVGAAIRPGGRRLMRIIAGRFKGRRLAGPTGAGVRPTSDRLRETLFNVVRDRTAGARVLDAYAGRGALGLEALSRGAVRATFVERDRQALAVLVRNIATCGAIEACATIRGDF